MKFSLYFTNSPWSPLGRICVKCGTTIGVADVIISNNFLVIGQGVRILWGSKIAISHWQSQSPLAQGWRYHAARDSIFDPTESTPVNRSPKNWYGWLSRRPLRLCQNLCKSVHTALRSFWAKEWNITIFYLFIYIFIHFFGNSPTGRIFTLHGSNDANSRKSVPFGVSLIVLPILAVKSPPQKNSNFEGRE